MKDEQVLYQVKEGEKQHHLVRLLMLLLLLLFLHFISVVIPLMHFYVYLDNFQPLDSPGNQIPASSMAPLWDILPTYPNNQMSAFSPYSYPPGFCMQNAIIKYNSKTYDEDDDADSTLSNDGEEGTSSTTQDKSLLSPLHSGDDRYGDDDDDMPFGSYRESQKALLT